MNNVGEKKETQTRQMQNKETMSNQFSKAKQREPENEKETETKTQIEIEADRQLRSLKAAMAKETEKKPE